MSSLESDVAKGANETENAQRASGTDEELLRRFRPASEVGALEDARELEEEG
jgi:hypothetical protein